MELLNPCKLIICKKMIISQQLRHTKNNALFCEHEQNEFLHQTSLVPQPKSPLPEEAIITREPAAGTGRRKHETCSSLSAPDSRFFGPPLSSSSSFSPLPCTRVQSSPSRFVPPCPGSRVRDNTHVYALYLLSSNKKRRCNEARVR